MQAISVSGGQLHYQTNYRRPVPATDEALIRVILAGICSTDLEIVRGYAGFAGVLGHEFVGVVTKAPQTDWIGRRVVGSINVGCGNCPVCMAQGPEHCKARSVCGIRGRDGAFAEFITLPQANLFAVPDEVMDDAAVFTEPLAAALRIREQIAIKPSLPIAVVGPGRLGLLVGQVLALAGSEVTMIGRRPESLLLPARLGLHTALRDDCAEDSYDFVVEATGNEEGLTHALRLTRPRGTLILKSTYTGKANIDLTKLVVGEITTIGSRCGPFAPALRLLARKQVDVQALIDAEYPLSEGLDAFAHAARPGVRKVLLRP